MRRSGIAAALLSLACAALAAVPTDAPNVPPEIETPAPPSHLSFSVSTSSSSPARLIANTYGVNHANKIEAIVFSFNMQYGEARARREWYWDVAENRIEYSGEGPTGLPISHIYHRDRLEDGDVLLNRRIDDQFIDDQYWLLFPFHLEWEKELLTAYEAERQMWIEPRTSECVTVRYPDGRPGGGDEYEIFYGSDWLIREWVYRPKGTDQPAFATTWERHAKAGPVLFSLMHRSDDGTFRIWFDRVAVKLVGEGWVEAEPLEHALSQTGSGALTRKPL